MTDDKKKTPYNSTASFYMKGADADKIGPLLTEWLIELEEKYDVETSSYNYNFYYNPQGIVDPAKLKKARHPNEGGADSFSVTTGK